MLAVFECKARLVSFAVTLALCAPIALFAQSKNSQAPRKLVEGLWIQKVPAPTVLSTEQYQFQPGGECTFSLHGAATGKWKRDSEWVIVTFLIDQNAELYSKPISWHVVLDGDVADIQFLKDTPACRFRRMIKAESNTDALAGVWNSRSCDVPGPPSGPLDNYLMGPYLEKVFGSNAMYAFKTDGTLNAGYTLFEPGRYRVEANKIVLSCAPAGREQTYAINADSSPPTLGGPGGGSTFRKMSSGEVVQIPPGR